MRKALFLLLCLMALLTAGGPARAAERQVPFVRYSLADGRYATLVHSDETGRYGLKIGGRVFTAPKDFVPLELTRLKNEKYLIFGRKLISGHNNLQLLDPASGKWKWLPLSHEERAHYFFHAAFSIHGRVFMLVFDVVRNTPSGRRISGLPQGLDLYEVVVRDGGVKLRAVRRALQMGGLYVNVRRVRLKDEAGEAALVCTQTACLHVGFDKGKVVTRLLERKEWRGKLLLEVATDGRKAYGLFRLDFDDRFQDIPDRDDPIYFICPITGLPEEELKEGCRPLPADAIPFHLRVEKGRSVYRLARSPEDYGEMLLFDLERLPRSGVDNLGNNNMEGTISWSQAYTLNAFVDVVSGLVNLGAGHDRMARLAKERLRLEMAHIVDLGRTMYPWYYTKRFSLDREPATSVVLLGRIVRLMRRARQVGAMKGHYDVFCDVVKWLHVPGRVNEELVGVDGKDPEIRVRRYVPYWADGVNMPWNYNSAWIDGIVYGRECGIPDKLLRFAGRLVERFVREEKIASLPKAWKYSYGDFLQGWSVKDDISTNTPEYKGDKRNTTTAHVSYRSMDAMALLAAHRAGIVRLPDGVIKHMRKLVENGLLWPFVAEELVPLHQRPALPFHISRLFVRSFLSWEVQNQVWALDALIRQGQ